MRFTDPQVRALQPPAKGAKVYYDDSLSGVGGRFGVRVSHAGTRAFILATGINRDRATIGRYPMISLADARDVARKMLAERTLGRHQEPKTALGTALDLYAEQHTAQLAPRTQKELERLFRRYLTKLRTKKLTEITTHDITGLTDKAAPSEAEHLHRACKTFFKWCVRRRLLQHSPLEGLELPSVWKPRERVLTDDELQRIWAATVTQSPFNDIMRLCLLTGLRRGELSSVEPEWLQNDVLVIPAAISKNRRIHSAPMPKLALPILERSPFSFNSWSKSKARLDAASGVTNWTIHDARRTAATNWQRHCGALTEDVEFLLGHVSGFRSGLIGTYQRWDRWPRLVELVTKYEAWFTTHIIGATP